MKAFGYTRYGPPDLLRLKELEPPSPKPNEVLVRIHAASVNPLDWHLLRGEPRLLRLMGFGLLRPKDGRLGADIAGLVESVGTNVTQFQPGDEVYGDVFRGGYAEYVCAMEDKLVQKPAGMTFDEAAAIPVAGLTALQGLRDRGRIQSGQSVLIHGASGGVGTFAVQIAKSFGARVTGVCSTRNLELVRSLGADDVIDYSRTDFAEQARRYDLILAVSGNRSVLEYRRALTPRGTWVGIGGSHSGLRMLANMLVGAGVTLLGRQRMVTMMADANRQDLQVLSTLWEAGKIKPVIDRRYALREVPDAIRYLEEGHARGKVVIHIGAESSSLFSAIGSS